MARAIDPVGGLLMRCQEWSNIGHSSKASPNVENGNLGEVLAPAGQSCGKFQISSLIEGHYLHIFLSTWQPFKFSYHCPYYPRAGQQRKISRL